jgi:hypothetical protein
MFLSVLQLADQNPTIYSGAQDCDPVPECSVMHDVILMVLQRLLLEALVKPFFCLMYLFSSVRAEGMPLAQSSLIANKLRLRTSLGFDIKQNP